MAVLVVMSAGTLVGAPIAQAATIDEGTLSLGVRTVLTSTDWDTHVYRLTVPGGQRLVISKEESDTPFDGNGRLYDATTGVYVAAVGMSNISAFERRAAEVPAVAAERVLRLEVEAHGAGVLPFTALGITDPPAQPITWNTPTPVALDAYQQAVLSFTGVAGKRLGISVSESTFAANGAVVTVLAPSPFGGGLMPVYTVGATGPPPVMTAADYQVRIDGDDAASGSLTVNIVEVADVTGTVVLGEPVTADIDTVWTQVSQTYTQVQGARLRFEVLSSTLRHADGSPGSAQANLVRRIGFFTSRIPVATIGSAPLSVVIDWPMEAGEGTFEIVPDGASTGVITYRLSALLDNPPVAAPLGEPISVDLSEAYTSRRYTFDASAGQRFTIEISDVALAAPAGTDVSVNPSILDAATGITTTLPQVRADQDGYSVPFSSAQVTSLTLILDPNQATTGSLTLTIRPVEDTTVTLEPGVTVTGSVPQGGGALVFGYGGTDSPDLPAITVEGSTLVDGAGNPTGAQLTFEQVGLAYGGFYSTYVGVERYSFLPPPELDPRRLWRLRAQVVGGTTGSLSLSLRPKTVTTASVALGATTVVRFEGLADSTELTFTPRAGRRIVVERRPGTVRAELELRTADGTSLGVSSDPDHAEFDASTTTQPLVLVVRPATSTNQVGSLPVVISQVSDPRLIADGATTVRWRLGQNPRLVFSGEKGQRISLAVSSASWQPTWRPVDVTLVDSRGRFVANVTSLFGGNEFVDTDARLPADGWYALVFDPRGESVGSLAATVRRIDDLRRNVVLGNAANLTFTEPGQRAYLRVQVTEGTRLTWSVPRATLTGTLTLLQGDNPIGFAQFGPDISGALSFESLSAGTYVVVVDPSQPPTGRLSLTLSRG